MSVSKTEIELLLENKEFLQDKESANIPAFSVASVTGEGVISRLAQGDVDSNGCGFFKMSKIPSREEQQEFNNSRYILSDAGFFYYNKFSDKLEAINLQSSKFEELESSFTEQAPIEKLSFDQLKQITSITGHYHANPSIPVTTETVFGAASLSKPLFAYIVLKMIASGAFSRADEPPESGLDRPLHELCDFGPPELRENPDYKLLTARTILSHQSGLPLLKYNIKPGKEYGYSGVPYFYLQEVIETLSNSTLETLAQKLVFKPLKMENSHFERACFKSDTPFADELNPAKWCGLIQQPRAPTEEEQQRFGNSRYILTEEGFLYYDLFKSKLETIKLDVSNLEELRNHYHDTKQIERLSDSQLKHITSITGHTAYSPAHAANSLYTTAKDYARFIRGWLNDKNTIIQSAFKSEVSMTEDQWAVSQGLSKEDTLKYVAWGLGWGLQVTRQEKSTRAFHSGDMNEWRAFVAINLENKSAVVYFANSPNGLVLADKIVSPIVDLKDGLKYIFEKYGFARTLEPCWKEKEIKRITEIIATYERPRIPTPVPSPQEKEESEQGITQQYKHKINEAKYPSESESTSLLEEEKGSTASVKITPKLPWTV